MTNDQLVFESRRLRCEGCQPSSTPREGWQPSQRLFNSSTLENDSSDIQALRKRARPLS